MKVTTLLNCREPRVVDIFAVSLLKEKKRLERSFKQAITPASHFIFFASQSSCKDLKRLFSGTQVSPRSQIWKELFLERKVRNYSLCCYPSINMQFKVCIKILEIIQVQAGLVTCPALSVLLTFPVYLFSSPPNGSPALLEHQGNGTPVSRGNQFIKRGDC